MNAPVTADVLKQAQALANADAGDLMVSKVTLTKSCDCYVAHPKDWTTDQLVAAVGTRHGDLMQRACWYDAESGPETLLYPGVDDRPIEMESEGDGPAMPKVEGPDPMILDEADLTPPVITVVEGA